MALCVQKDFPEAEQPCMTIEGRVSQYDSQHQSTAYCETAERLLAKFGQAVQGVLALHEQQFRAIVEGDSEAGRFDLMIHEAVEDKQNAKYAYLTHLDLHRCSSYWR
jgi:hypothetical protein